MVGTSLNPEAVSFTIHPLSDAHDVEHTAHYAESDTKEDPLTAMIATLRVENEKDSMREPVDDFLARLAAKRADNAISRTFVDGSKALGDVTAHHYKSPTALNSEKAASILTEPSADSEIVRGLSKSEEPPTLAKFTSTLLPIEVQSRARNEGYKNGWYNGRELGYRLGFSSGRKHGRLIDTAVGRDRGKEEGIEIGKLIGWDMGVVHGRAIDKAKYMADGKALGEIQGFAEGKAVGMLEGLKEGRAMVTEEGQAMVFEEGHASGRAQGRQEGEAIGWSKGHEEGKILGQKVGYAEGKIFGQTEAFEKGKAVGHAEGLEEGKKLGRQEERAKGTMIGRDQEVEKTKKMGSELVVEERNAFGHEEAAAGNEDCDSHQDLKKMEQWLEDIKKPIPVKNVYGAKKSISVKEGYGVKKPSVMPPGPDPFRFIFEDFMNRKTSGTKAS